MLIQGQIVQECSTGWKRNQVHSMTAILQKKAGWNVWSGQAHTHTHSLTHTHAYAYDGVKEGKL